MQIVSSCWSSNVEGPFPPFSVSFWEWQNSWSEHNARIDAQKDQKQISASFADMMEPGHWLTSKPKDIVCTRSFVWSEASAVLEVLMWSRGFKSKINLADAFKTRLRGASVASGNHTLWFLQTMQIFSLHSPCFSFKLCISFPSYHDDDNNNLGWWQCHRVVLDIKPSLPIFLFLSYSLSGWLQAHLHVQQIRTMFPTFLVIRRIPFVDSGIWVTPGS